MRESGTDIEPAPHRELGDASEKMVRRVYAHLGNVRHRSRVVEVRLDQHLEAQGPAGPIGV